MGRTQKGSFFEDLRKVKKNSPWNWSKCQIYCCFLELWLPFSDSRSCCLQSCRPILLQAKTATVYNERSQFPSWQKCTNTGSRSILSREGKQHFLYKKQSWNPKLPNTSSFFSTDKLYKTKSSQCNLWNSPFTILSPLYREHGWFLLKSRVQ